MRRRRLPQIPPFRRAADLWGRAGRLLRPRDPIKVSDWAIKHTGYDPDVLPWQTEIMDALAFGDVDLMGPAQAGKTEIGLAWWGWTIDHSPADFMICQSDKNLMQDLVVRRMQPMVDRVDVLKQALQTGSGADNIFLKQFQGMLSTHIWPVAAQFTARPQERCWLDDFDQIPDDIEGQGSAHKLTEGRQTWFEGRSRTFTSSSPAREDASGIEARVVGGTDERLWPECPHCKDRFEIQFDVHLKYTKGTAEEAEASAFLTCSNACIIKAGEKRKLLDSLTRLPNRGWRANNPAARRRSFRLDGLMNIRSWGSLAKALREAELAWEQRQDETELRAVWNTKGGKNYRSKAAGLKALTKEDLAGRIEPAWQMGTVPAGARVVVASVDTQANRWEVMVRAFGEGLESWIVDRFDISTLEDGLTLVDPAMNPEHWAVLTTKVVQRRYPMAQDPTVLVPILTTAVDTGGEAGVSQNAANWYRACLRMGISRDRITLVKGSSNIRQSKPMMAAWLDQKKKGGPEKRGVRLWTVDTHALKNVIDVRLRRTEPGPGAIHFPQGFELVWLDELTAEQKIKGKWAKMRPRNETLDLMVYTDGALLRPPFAQTRADMGWVPADFRVPVLNAPAQSTEQKVAPDEAKASPASPPAAAPSSLPRPGPLPAPARQPAPPPGRGNNDWIGAGSDWL